MTAAATGSFTRISPWRSSSTPDGCVWCTQAIGTGSTWATLVPASCSQVERRPRICMARIEHGRWKRDIYHRHYYWDGPVCWVDERTLVIWGFGNDEDNLILAALLFDVETGRRVRWFAGPVGSLVYDRYLYSYSIESGTSAWDLVTGERLLHDASFCPTTYHRGAGKFITALPDGRFRLSPLVDG